MQRRIMGENSEVRRNTHTTILWSLSLSVMNTTWVNTAEERFAQTLSGVRLSPRICGARTFQYNNATTVHTACASQLPAQPEALLDRRGR